MTAACSYCVSANMAKPRSLIRITQSVSADVTQASIAAGRILTHIRVRFIDNKYPTDLDCVVEDNHCPVRDKRHKVLPNCSRERVAPPPLFLLLNSTRVTERSLLMEGCEYMKRCRSPETYLESFGWREWPQDLPQAEEWIDGMLVCKRDEVPTCEDPAHVTYSVSSRNFSNFVANLGSFPFTILRPGIDLQSSLHV